MTASERRLTVPVATAFSGVASRVAAAAISGRGGRPPGLLRPVVTAKK